MTLYRATDCFAGIISFAALNRVMTTTRSNSKDFQIVRLQRLKNGSNWVLLTTVESIKHSTANFRSRYRMSKNGNLNRGKCFNRLFLHFQQLTVSGTKKRLRMNFRGESNPWKKQVNLSSKWDRICRITCRDLWLKAKKLCKNA